MRVTDMSAIKWENSQKRALTLDMVPAVLRIVRLKIEEQVERGLSLCVEKFISSARLEIMHLVQRVGRHQNNLIKKRLLGIFVARDAYSGPEALASVKDWIPNKRRCRPCERRRRFFCARHLRIALSSDLNGCTEDREAKGRTSN